MNTELLKPGNYAKINYGNSFWDGWKKIKTVRDDGISVYSGDVTGFFGFSEVIDVKPMSWKEKYGGYKNAINM